MAAITQLIREQHQQLLPHIEHLRIIADEVGETPLKALQQTLDDIYIFLTMELIPHGQAELMVFYPTVDKVLGAPQATEPMQQDHIEIERLIGEFAGLRSELAAAFIEERQAKTLRRILYSLYALTKAHLIKEEEIYLPLLEARLSSEDAQALAKALDQATQDLKAQLAH